mgnify:CR=1 FL=1
MCIQGLAYKLGLVVLNLAHINWEIFSIETEDKWKAFSLSFTMVQ